MSQHIGTQEQLLSRKAVAERWQTSTETVKRKEKAGLLKAIRFNKRLLRYRLSDVIAFEAVAARTNFDGKNAAEPKREKGRKK